MHAAQREPSFYSGKLECDSDVSELIDRWQIYLSSGLRHRVPSHAMVRPSPREIIERLRQFNWERHDVEYVLIFGSAAREQRSYRDVDIAVKFRDYTFDKYVNLLVDLAEHLQMPEDLLDIVVLNLRDNVPCALLVEIFSHGVLLYARDHRAYIHDLLSWYNVCLDFLTDREKLGVVKSALDAVLRRWGS